jgi:hypothetical protein
LQYRSVASRIGVTAKSLTNARLNFHSKREEKLWAAFHKFDSGCGVQPPYLSKYNGPFDNFPDRRIDSGIPRQRVVAR